MSSVWVLEQGEYSDYRVIGVFPSKENAELVLHSIPQDESSWDRPTIAEWELDPKISELRKGYKAFQLRMLRDGSIECCKEDEMSTYALFSCELMVWRREEASAYRGKGIPNCLSGVVLAKDQKHAIKIANEKRAQLIAAGKF